MGSPYIPYIPPGGRRLNVDGTCDIRCRVCGKTISRRNYDRFSTAICAVCYDAELAGKTWEEIIYAKQQAELAQGAKAQDDLGLVGFKAHGLVKRVKEVIGEIKRRIVTSRRKITTD